MPVRPSTYLLALFLVVAGNAAVAGEVVVPVARDLQTDAGRSRTARLPILLMVSRSDCGYCALLKREIIRPMLVSGAYESKVIVRELLLDEETRIVDFDGTAIKATDLAHRYDEWLTPTLLFLAADGEELVERIRGIGSVDYYGYYLDQAIDQAIAALSSLR